MPEHAERDRELLERHGHDTTSFQALGPGLRRYRHGDRGWIAWRDTGGAWVAAGGPIAAPGDVPEVLAGFVAAARAAGRRPVLFGVESRELDAPGLVRLKIGEQPVWDPARWPAALRGKRSLREQLRRAQAKGVRVRSVGVDELESGRPLRRRVERLVRRWLASRRMAPMGFVVHVAPFDLPAERRFLVAERGADLVGMLVAVPIYARDGWLLEDVLRDPEAPNGTVELLFDAALRQLAAEGSAHVTFGLAPLARVASPALRRIRGWARPLYDFDGLLRFKTKLQPCAWHAVHVAHPAGISDTRAVLDVLRAFAGRGGFAGFGWRTLVHRAPLVTRWLAVLLLPWIALLAWGAGPRWFPAPWVRSAWLIFDAVLCALLLTLAQRWRRRLATLCAALAAVDFLLGVAQLVWHNAAQPRRPGDLLFVVGALAAPLFATALLWQARDRQRALERARAASVR